MAYKKVGVYGSTGRLGRELTRALVDEGFEVVPFSRHITTVAGIPTQRLGSLVGFDAVVAAVGHAADDQQISLIQQAKKDGVKRFVPSEFGVGPQSLPFPFFDGKRKIAKIVQEASFPDGWTAFACGFFEWVIPYAVQVDSESATITVGGSGQKIYPFTLQYDVGRALAETFKNPAKYKDSWILLANNWLSLDDIAVHIQQQSQGKWTIRHIDLDDRTPVLKLFEESDENVFDRSQQTNLPIELCDIKDQVKVP